MFSRVRGVTSKAAKPSSRYNPKFWWYSCGSCESRYDPTNSQVAAPSKLPMVTSKSESVARLHHASYFGVGCGEFQSFPQQVFVNQRIEFNYVKADKGAGGLAADVLAPLYDRVRVLPLVQAGGTFF